MSRCKRVGGGLLALALSLTCGGRVGAQDPPKERAQEELRLQELLLRRIQVDQQAQDQVIELQRRVLRLGMEQEVQVQVLERHLGLQQDGDAASSRKRLETLLKAEVDDIDRACTLTEEQKRKLYLAGRGDVNRFFNRFEGVKNNAVAAGGDGVVLWGLDDGGVVVGRAEGFKVLVGGIQGVQHEAASLRTALQTGIFREDSLLYKSLRNTLTEEQLTRYRASRTKQYQASIEAAVKFLERRARMDKDKRRELVALLQNEATPVGKPGQNDHYRVLIQMSRLPEEKLRPLFDEAQWHDVSAVLKRYQLLEPQLREAGRFQVDGDEVFILRGGLEANPRK